MQDRFYVANHLRAIGQLLALKRDNPFKAQAYERGAHALENLAEDFDAFVRAHRLTAIPGIGSALAAVIEEVYQTGKHKNNFAIGKTTSSFYNLSVKQNGQVIRSEKIFIEN